MKFLEAYNEIESLVIKHAQIRGVGRQAFGFNVETNFINFRIREDNTIWVSFDTTVCGKPHRVSEDVLHSSEFWLEILHKHLEEA